jgi:orotate phosphoribosyltransferase-like protein
MATLEQINRVMELHNAGLSLSQILKQLNMPWHKGTIKNIIDREKLKLQQQRK